ncbi:TIGR02206 family membrane protein [Evansella sp. AB-P1]|uniref:YwaF family protein n=1 Tax=Evansella sp. AB-P1 TaxID=3037653 RepID=UPI00241E22C6|nr:TIGR02206 family membrane protein [Evansella sp. AB-P1]MDG5789561.1 TIGR02206 family membrane protein [Evansella sp. AB-P1]
MIEQFLNPSTFREQALFLSPAHIIVLIVFVLSMVWIYFHRNKQYMRHVRWIIFVLLIFSEISLIAWTIYHGLWSVRFHLPLNLCTISLYVTAFMIVFRSYAIFEIVYFFGVGGAIQALLTPDLFYTFPHFRFLHFFIAHIAIILGIFYMVFVYKFRPTFRSMIKSFVALNVIAFIVFWVNIMTGANYMFLARKPEGPSILDLLGPYPWYILSLELVAIVMFILLYLPFYILQKKEE